ncbi:hypothetical protein SAMN05216577_105115 [Pseudomonas citronellolis]|uniref:Dimethylamine monooxygenase subunit DmmA-like C-terminal domain-containing protein n=1 Tax=Pseudomonas citronellolis TaxID=53408 RepID=A0AAQ1HKK4_9PSED|nr:dimethylamine monooxygenase subunit DmmA family protein [Pseudomonas citronellolis]TGC27815.1 hypothetical protein CW310_16105 [Pseudomonas citronellolis]GBL54977.1 hypothetical protein PCLA_03r0273 [Pseudomonas citronellolis]SFC39244.1 hypothetical protein SAMN05216577_105115 [Pseudomonas citronellolis]
MTDTALCASAPSLPSLPRYDAPPRLAGGQALLVMQQADADQARALAARLGLAAGELELLATDAQNAQRALQERLASASVGLQLLLWGDEAFLWPLHALARQAGLLPDEIHLLRQGGAARTLYCVHCGTLQSAGAADHHDCRQCGVRLEVRRHFSQRLGAYLGVCADADHPYAEARP